MPKKTAHIFEEKWRSDDVRLQETSDFSSFMLSDRVLVGLKKAGFKTPSPIQMEAIPIGRFGKDMIVQAKSGTGKTLVFTIIALDFLRDEKQPQALILAPTREIAFQICDVIKSVSSGFKYLKCAAFIGGISIEEDRKNIIGCQIVVGTPGRIKQLLSLKILYPNFIHLLVLDEVDQLLESSFKSDLDSIFVSLPQEKQVITTSATYPSSLKKLSTRYFRVDPYLARLNVNDLALLGTLHYIQIVNQNPMPVLAYQAKMRVLENLLKSVDFSQCLVFCNMVSKVETICDDIKSLGFSATFISSAKDQVARLKAIEYLKRYKCKVLVTSDLTSRGIDAENVDLIVNVDLPYTTEVYLHRVGRAGRYGSKGLAVTFVAPNEIFSFKRMQKSANFKSYFLPAQIPGNLINCIPDPEAEVMKDESFPSSSDDEPATQDNKPSRSRSKRNLTDHASNGTGKNATVHQGPDTKSEILKDTENGSDISVEEFEELDYVPSDSTVRHVSNGSSKSATVIENDEKFLSSIENNTVNDKSMVTGELISLNESSKSTAEGEANSKIGKDSEEIEEAYETAESNDLNSLENCNQNDTSTDGEDQSDSLYIEQEDSSESKLAELIMAIEKTEDTEKKSSSSESANTSEINDNSQISEEFDSNEVVVPLVREESNETEIVSSSEVEVPVLNLDGKSTSSSVGVVTVGESVSNDGEKCKLSVNVDDLCEAVEGSSLDKEKVNEVPENGNIDINPVQVDEVTACVVNFIHNYESKVVDGLNGIPVNVKPVKSDSSDPKSLIHGLVSDRMGLKDHYIEAFQTYRNENIAGDTSEILKRIQAENIIPPVKKDENCSMTTTENDAIPNSNKLDLNSCSMKLNEIELNSTEESASSSCSSSGVIFESTPVKAAILRTKKALLDVSSDTPSFLNLVDDPETDDSSNSEYSNKCSKLENACKNKIRNGSKGQVVSKHSSNTESASSSSDTKESPKRSNTLTLLERAYRKMEETNIKKQTLGQKADVLRKVLHGFEIEIPESQESKESISDIQISTAGNSSKVCRNKNPSNNANLLHGTKQRKSSSSLSSSMNLGDRANAKRSTDSGSSSSEDCGRNVNSRQGKYRKYSPSSKMSSDDSESSDSYSSASNCIENRKKSKAAKSQTRSRAEKAHLRFHQDSFVSANQHNFHSHPSNSSQVNDSFFSHQGAFENNVQPTHEHEAACYMPSQHQCYSVDGQSSCQSQSCTAWYDMFYRQWCFIQQSSYF